MSRNVLDRKEVIELTDKTLGQRSRVDLSVNGQTHSIALYGTASVTLAAGAASGTLRNKGSLWAMVRSIVIDENGQTRWSVPAKVLRALTEMQAPQPLSSVRLVDGSIQGPTLLNELIVLQMASPLVANSKETAYAEADPTKPFQLHFETEAAPRDSLLEANDRTFTLNSLQIEIGQEIDFESVNPPIFVPVVHELANEVISGTVTDFIIKISSEHRLAAILVLSEADGYEVDDIITNLKLVSDAKEFHRGKFTEAFFTNLAQTKFGGNVVDAGYTFYNFLSGGRLTNALNPGRQPNLRLIADVTPTATIAGSPTSVIRVFGIEYQMVPGVTRDPADIPFPLS